MVSILSVNDQEMINTSLNKELGRLKDLHGVSTVTSHRIVMNDHRLFKLRYAARDPAMQTIIYKKEGQRTVSKKVRRAISEFIQLTDQLSPKEE